MNDPLGTNERLATNDRREHRRCPVPRSGRVRARVARFGGPESSGDVVDLSAGGVMIRTLSQLREGDCVWVRLAGPSSHWTVFGEVRRARSRGDDEALVAIAFDSPRAQEASMVERKRPRRPGRERPWLRSVK